MRIIAVFEKSPRIRHIGHLDIQRAVQRGLRRSGLPVAYSNGFNPHILITFASALSTGACGKRELMDVRMAEEVTPEVFLQAMNHAMPSEMRLLGAKAVDDHAPALMAMLTDASYDLLIYDPLQAERLIAAIPGMLEQEMIPAVRKTKTGMKPCDIKPLIDMLYGEGQHLYATLRLREQEACKPGMLVDALREKAGVTEEVRMLITRTGLWGRNESGTLVPLEDL